MDPLQGWNKNVGKSFVLIRDSAGNASTSKLTEVGDDLFACGYMIEGPGFLQAIRPVSVFRDYHIFLPFTGPVTTLALQRQREIKRVSLPR